MIIFLETWFLNIFTIVASYILSFHTTIFYGLMMGMAGPYLLCLFSFLFSFFPATRKAGLVIAFFPFMFICMFFFTYGAPAVAIIVAWIFAKIDKKFQNVNWCGIFFKKRKDVTSPNNLSE
jgi:hypothetical protein